MDCILYIDLFFLWNFWMNALILFLVRWITRTYRTLWCLLAAAIGAASACFGVILYLQSVRIPYLLFLELGVVVLMNMLAFGARNLLWHLFLFLVVSAGTAGVFLYAVSLSGSKTELPAIVFVSLAAFLGCFVLEKQSRIRWKEEHMKTKAVLEFGDRKLLATALMDTGNKLYDPFYHKPVILVDEKLVWEMLAYCKENCPERLHFIPFHSVGKENGILEGITFDCVRIRWENKQWNFENVIAAATKESLYKGKEYQVIFHCGLLQEN